MSVFGDGLMNNDLTRATASELADLYRSGKASPVEAVQAVLDRVAVLNPLLNALTRVDADEAISAAKLSESRWQANQPLSPIDGVPASIKELIRVKGWPQTMASQLTDKAPALEDAPAVARLREAGVIIFAQSTSPEYGYKGVTDSPLNGVTRNPWNPDRTPGGSSGGAAAAVAAGLGPLAIGTDGGGSIRIPASFTGLVGLKATFGRVPAWPSSMHGDLANTGPMTRTVLDNALMMNQIARPDVRDPFSLPDDKVDYVSQLTDTLRGKKIGLIMPFGDAYLDPEVADRVVLAARAFVELGARVEEVRPPTDISVIGRVWSVHWLSALQRLLQVYPESRHQEFDPNLLAQARVGATFSLQDVVDAQVARRDISTSWNLLFERYDLIISPTLAVLPFGLNQNLPMGPDGNPNPNWACTVTYNLTRHPAVSVPCGLSRDGLPIGLQIAAGHYRDADVLAAAAAFERHSGWTLPALPSS